MIPWVGRANPKSSIRNRIHNRVNCPSIHVVAKTTHLASISLAKTPSQSILRFTWTNFESVDGFHDQWGIWHETIDGDGQFPLEIRCVRSNLRKDERSVLQWKPSYRDAQQSAEQFTSTPLRSKTGNKRVHRNPRIRHHIQFRFTALRSSEM